MTAYLLLTTPIYARKASICTNSSALDFILFFVNFVLPAKFLRKPFKLRYLLSNIWYQKKNQKK